jgi:ubiquinone/menaquinone biosynthesis C-methylase UbiE
MTVRKDTLFERFLAPVVNTFLIDQAALKRLTESIDWDAETHRLTDPRLTYPEYYSGQNFHGIAGGYLTTTAAVTYDPITQYALPPGEALVRQGLLDRIHTHPRRILDLGCGTGSMTRLLQQQFPQAAVIGLDLSPHMLVMAAHKAAIAPSPRASAPSAAIQWRHGNAEHTGLPPASCDLITAALLFHETPPTVAQAILREAYRLLMPGGELLILDGHQAILRQTAWLTDIFEEPYIRDYAEGSVAAWMGAAGFEAVRSHDHYVLHQITQGIKPLPSQPLNRQVPDEWANETGPWVMA